MQQPLWKATLFGDLRITSGLTTSGMAREITRFSREKAGALFGYLAYHEDREHSREVLIAEFWPEHAPRSGRNCLSIALSSLRRQFELPGIQPNQVFRTDAQSVALIPGVIGTDVQEFTALLTQAQRAPGPALRLRYLTEAVKRYTGPLLPGYYDEWLLSPRAHECIRYLCALREIVVLLRQEQRYGEALTYALAAVQANDESEEWHREVIRLFADCSDGGSGLTYYRVLRDRLSRQGLTPEVATEQLVAQLKAASTAAVTQCIRGNPPSADAVPTGIVTLLYAHGQSATDLDGRDSDPEDTLDVLCTHMRAHRGHVISTENGHVLAVFSHAGAALMCALAGTAGMETTRHFTTRWALHTIETDAPLMHAHGPGVERISSVLAAAPPKTVLCTEVTAQVLQALPDLNVRLKDMGRYRLPSTATPVRLYMAQHPATPEIDCPRPLVPPAYAGKLPRSLAPFFGRADEQIHLCQMLRDPYRRLITLTGTGGIGKTRLAQQVAWQLLEEWQGSVWFIPMADLVGVQGSMLELLNRVCSSHYPLRGADHVHQKVPCCPVGRTTPSARSHRPLQQAL